MLNFINISGGYRSGGDGKPDYYNADTIGRISLSGDTVVIHDKAGEILAEKTFESGPPENDIPGMFFALDYARALTHAMQPVIPLAPGFFMVSCLEVNDYEVKEWAPLVGMITGIYPALTLYLDILGKFWETEIEYAVLHKPSGMVFTDSESFESADKWREHVPEMVRAKRETEAEDAEAEKIAHIKGNERAGYPHVDA